MVEVLARDTLTGRFVGLEVKAGTPQVHGDAEIHVQKTTFVPSSSTVMVALVWLPTSGQFAEECLVIPTENLRGIAIDSGTHFDILFSPRQSETNTTGPLQTQTQGPCSRDRSVKASSR